MADHAFNRDRFITISSGTVTIDDTDPDHININEIAESPITVGAGNTNANTQRINSSTDDINLAAINSSTASVDGKLPSQGKAVMTASVPVVIASDQNLQVQSNNANLATEATLISVDTNTTDIATNVVAFVKLLN